MDAIRSKTLDAFFDAIHTRGDGRRVTWSQRVWLDCDPGHDDALAIILAGHSPSCYLLGISTVASNQILEKVTRNALDVCYAANLTYIGVVPGQHKPLLRRAPLLCPEIHGESGLDGPEGKPILPRSPHPAMDGKAINVMFEAINAAYQEKPQPVKLVCTGALTNAALLMSVYPEVIPMVEVVVMGGCMGIGNTGAVVEFNIQTDPEAAQLVFESGVDLTLVPLEVTHTALVTPGVLKQLVKPHVATVDQSAFLHAIEQLLMFFAKTYREVFKFEDPPLHDPCAVAYALFPDMFQAELMRVDIETCSRLAAGQTVCDVWGQSDKPKNCKVATKMDLERFWALLEESLQRADAVSPLNYTAMESPSQQE